MLAHDDLGRGPPWLLLHGFPLTRRLWAPQHALADRARLVLPDLPGFGATGGPGAPSMDAMARAVLGLADDLGLDRFGVAGLSMGGYVALALHALAPERVAALVLADTQAGADDAAARAKREDLARKVEAEGIEVLVRDFTPKLLREGAPARLREDVAAMVRQNQPPPMAAALRAMGAREDHRERLRGIRVPALLLAGGQDALIPVAKHQEMQRLLPDARLVVLPDAGHLSNLEAPEAFNDAVAAFMAAVTEGKEFRSPRGAAVR